jgi:hypothetical protein
MLRGSCQCGTVRYEIRTAPRAMYHCHCAQCRKANGASVATNVLVDSDAFEVTEGRDRLGAYESSPQKHRYFCSVCGSPIYSHSARSAQIVSVRSGTLDGDPGIRPSFHSWTSAKAPWTLISDGLPERAAGIA